MSLEDDTMNETIIDNEVTHLRQHRLGTDNSNIKQKQKDLDNDQPKSHVKFGHNKVSRVKSNILQNFDQIKELLYPENSECNDKEVFLKVQNEAFATMDDLNQKLENIPHGVFELG